MTDAPGVLKLGECRDILLVGGKAINLAHAIAAGFPVPDGFVVTAAAHRAAGPDGSLPPEVAKDIAQAYVRLGAPVVAVRSSATAEDLAGASMAGQYETFLDVVGEADLLEAVRKCWASLRGDRILSYLAERKIDPSTVAMAVIVQRLVPAEVAGVLFTANPRTGAQDEMLIEASWGLGEAVVSGMVQPDTLVLDHATGRVKAATISAKETWVPAGARGRQPVPEEKRRQPCLTAENVRDLWHLGLRVMDHFGSAQDLEWAISGGRPFLLQSRAITTLEDAEAYQRCLQQARAQLRKRKQEGRGDWVRHNISETLPHPTPLTWSVIRRFMSGDGGFGAMYRTVGFEPAEPVRTEGFLELIAGRIYMDLSRAPDMFFDAFPYRYDLELLRTNPDASQGPPTAPAGSRTDRIRVGRRLAAVNAKIEALARSYDRELDGRIIPAFVDYVRSEKAVDLTRLSVDAWLSLWHDREKRVLDEFGPQSLLPSLFAAMATEKLRAFLDEHFWDDDPLALATLLAAGAEPDLTLQASQALYELARGDYPAEKWLERYGHRAPEEFDLATPRWAQRAGALETMAAHLARGASPLAMHERRAAEAERTWKSLAARLSWSKRRTLRRHLDLARRYLRFREDGKHYLMMGYDLLRDMALEAGRRLKIGEDVFLMTFEELRDALTTGFAPLHLIDARRRERAAESRIVLAHVIAEGGIDDFGAPPKGESGKACAAFPLSAGRRSGPVRIVRAPHEAGDLGRDYVLVCPSTDPNWTPLFVNAAGLVLECGGTLSHGAVVAREMGIPAVVYAGATTILRDGENVVVDGDRGLIVRADGLDAGAAASAAAPAVEDPADTRIARELTPPVPGGRESRSTAVRNACLLAWSLFLAAAFLLPGTWIYDESMRLMDAALWPVVAAWGKPAAVAVVAAGLAVITMVGQWLLTDNRRLRIAKQRAGRLRKLAADLPEDSPRRKTMLQLARPVQARVVKAALVPLAVVLGPMVLSFLWWFPARVDPASWNPEPGTTAFVVATVDGEFTGPVTMELDEALELVDAESASQRLTPIRDVLERRLGEWQKESNYKDLPWELREVGQWARGDLLADLTAYLKDRLPPRTLAWSVRTPGEAGRFTVTLSYPGGQPVAADLVLGDAFAPPPREDLGDGKAVGVFRPSDPESKIQSVAVRYEQKPPGKFYTPFAAVGSSWDVGWLLLYVAVYLPVMLACRWVLRVP